MSFVGTFSNDPISQWPYKSCCDNSNQTTLKERLERVCYLEDFKGSDYTDKMNYAVAACCKNNRALILPDKHFTSRGGHILTADIPIIGISKEASVINYDQVNATNHLFVKDWTDTNPISVTLMNFKVVGSWATVQNEIDERAVVGLYYVKNLILENFRMEDICFMGVKCVDVLNTQTTNCSAERMTRDAFNISNGWRCKHIGLDVRHCDDDAVAFHVTQYEPIESDVPISSCFSCIGGHFVDTGSIKALGGKNFTVQGNVGERMKNKSVCIDYDTGSLEGYTSAFGVNINGNNFTDNMRVGTYPGTSVEYIRLAGSVPVSVSSGTAIPLCSATATGVVTDYLPYLRNEDHPSARSQAGAFFHRAQGNILARTLPDVTKYSQLGYGQCFKKTGFYDPDITASTDQDGYGFHIKDSARNCDIESNTVATGKSSVFLTTRSTQRDYSFMNLGIRRNRMLRFGDSAVGNDFPVDVIVDISVEDNDMNGDLLCTHANRNANGKWKTDTQTLPCGIDAIHLKGLTYGGNHYRNVLQTVRTDANSVVTQSKQDILHCKPTATGASVDNIGIGVVATGQKYVCEDGDPQSATFLQMLNRADYNGVLGE